MKSTMPGMVLLLSVLMVLSGLPGPLPGPVSPSVLRAAGPASAAALPVSPSVLRAAGPAAVPPGVSLRPASGARRVSALAAVPPGEFGLPIDGARLVRRFDPPPQRWLPGHRGADLAAPAGTAVRAAGAGSIVYAGQIAGRGVVSIAHPGGLRTTYEPVLVGDHRPGDPVTVGERIGTLAPGHPGCPAAACLHWGLRRGADYLDPLALLGLGRVRLLPL